jgi:hypothetical protein
MVPQSMDVSWLPIFLDLCDYYQRFVKKISNIAKHLTQLNKIDHDYIWGEAQE